MSTCGFKPSFLICPGSVGCAVGANTHAQSDSSDSSIQSPALLLYKAGLATSYLVFRESFPREGCCEEHPTGEEDWVLNRAESTAFHHLNMCQCTPLPSSTVPAAMKTVGISSQKTQARMCSSYHMGVCLLPFLTTAPPLYEEMK